MPLPRHVVTSRLALGGGPVGNLFQPMADETAGALLATAWAEGIRYFDTAPRYGFGLSERRFGDFLRARERGTYALSTKVGRRLRPNAGWHAARAYYPDALPFEPWPDYGYDGVMRSYEDSLQRLGLDRLDILLLHDIGERTYGRDRHQAIMADAMDGGYRALDELRRHGDVAAIGIGVGECAVCLEVLQHGTWDLFMVAGRYTLLEQEALDQLLPRCLEAGTAVVVAAPFNSGILATGTAGATRYDYGEAPMAVIAKVRRIEEVCRAHGVPLPAAALRFPLLHPAVVSVVAGFAERGELEQAAAWMKLPIPLALWRDLQTERLLRADVPVG